MHSVLDPCTILRVQSWDLRTGPPSRAEDVVGMTWPRITGTFVRGQAEVLCIGPTDWLVFSDRDGIALSQALAGAFRDSSYRATDLSSALCRVRIGGAQARALLSKGCSLDVSPEAFPPGKCARTRFAGMPVIVRAVGVETFECTVSLGYGEYLMDWLEDAASAL